MGRRRWRRTSKRWKVGEGGIGERVGGGWGKEVDHENEQTVVWEEKLD